VAVAAKTIGSLDGCTAKSATTTVAMSATGIFSSTARGVGSSARNVVDNTSSNTDAVDHGTFWLESFVQLHLEQMPLSAAR
jgi:hypothetical protein